MTMVDLYFRRKNTRGFFYIVSDYLIDWPVEIIVQLFFMKDEICIASTPADFVVTVSKSVFVKFYAFL